VNAEDLQVLSELCVQTNDIVDQLRALARIPSEADATDVRQAIALLRHNIGTFTEHIAAREAASWGDMSLHNARHEPNRWIRPRTPGAPAGMGQGYRVKRYDAAGNFIGYRDA
jgi:hypothetical protein